MIRIMKKAGDEYRAEYVTGKELRKWFADHVTKDGDVTEDVVVYDHVEVKADGDGYQWTLSDFTLDRDMERIDPGGWDLKQFKTNPIVLWAHDVMIPAIGSITNVRRESGEDGALIGKIVFDDDDPFAAMIHRKVEKGILSRGSVGFKPQKIEWVEDEKDPTKLIYRKQELYEFSIVNVPANPNAGRRSFDKEADKSLDKEGTIHNNYIELFEDRREASAEPVGEASPLEALFNANNNKTIEEVLYGTGN